jgi:amino-acid N-acetyltransferase
MLSASDLPIDDIDEHIARFVLAKWDGATIGSVAVEYAGAAGLLRSLCVTPIHRGQTVGAQLLAAIEARATARGIRELYLLTTNSAAFFEHHGFFWRTSREEVPDGIRSAAQFRTLCPSTAACMRKTLPPTPFLVPRSASCGRHTGPEHCGSGTFSRIAPD